ncbi:hypothetical protein [Paenibacillus lentus]|uniref:Uncharacterized protein n=1 Tax=Paenibacillus lentus TaxID=1338368 RepID=A0A3S8S0P2_9BACL|nr:hypothetical protein [Paenibacillus lentus]AZK48782.1 hypothetical protein EIM92_23520 [Paenibacillus lentus]
MIKIFRSTDQLEAIEFADSERETIQQLIALTGKSITVEYGEDGAVRAGIIMDAAKMKVVNLGQYVYRDREGNIGICDYEYLVERFELLDTTPTESN